MPTQGVYGRCAPGEMLALLGPSGSGKSTFLDMLSGRKSLGMMTGCTTLNGKAVSGTGMRRLAAYVVQVRQGFRVGGRAWGDQNGVRQGGLGHWARGGWIGRGWGFRALGSARVDTGQVGLWLLILGSGRLDR